MPRFTTKYHGLSQRISVWVCKKCLVWHERKKPAKCISCGHDKFLYFPSRIEAVRYAELRLLEKVGEITELTYQPKYPIIINGKHVRDYIADSSYKKKGVQIVEDVKAKNNITDLAKFKIEIVEALYGIKITIVEKG